ncbi:MAG: pseudouridine synthase [Desulforhopalus sp.]|jgi:pseudouridine synthase
MRLQKYLSEVGFCSRRDAEEFISAGKILINGVVATLGDKVTGQEKIVIDGKELETHKLPPRKVLVFFKPSGVECTLAPRGDIKTLLDFDFGPDRVFPIGYLERESGGLLLLTNDGNLGNRLTQPTRGEENEYLMVVENDMTSALISRLNQAIAAAHKLIYPGEIVDVGDNKFKIVLKNGKGKLIRKACDDLGIEIIDLLRVRVGDIGLENLEAGAWRALTENEIKAL